MRVHTLGLPKLGLEVPFLPCLLLLLFLPLKPIENAPNSSPESSQPSPIPSYVGTGDLVSGVIWLGSLLYWHLLGASPHTQLSTTQKKKRVTQKFGIIMGKESSSSKKKKRTKGRPLPRSSTRIGHALYCTEGGDREYVQYSGTYICHAIPYLKVMCTWIWDDLKKANRASPHALLSPADCFFYFFFFSLFSLFWVSFPCFDCSLRDPCLRAKPHSSRYFVGSPMIVIIFWYLSTVPRQESESASSSQLSQKKRSTCF